VPFGKAFLQAGALLGGGRFQLLRRIGEGGMGAVYEALDKERRAHVALKVLSVVDGRGIYQFKNEFRALSSIHHPNLVHLHQLFVDEDIWFFTMDLIDGEPFDLWARPEGELDEGRIRFGVRQLVLGLSEIHHAGKLHRDVKSGNVLVTPESRVVILDLGLVAEGFKGGAGQTITEWVLAGTPEYMAPEQAFGFPPTTASDFYAVGVMLFEALTGELPFEGSVSEILIAKQQEPPSWPVLDATRVPADLRDLCRALLAKDPEQRPTAAQMLESPSLAGSGAVVLEPLRPPFVPGPPRALLGRDAELEVLRGAHRDAMAGEAVLVVVSGESGIGKTELCQSFLDEVRADRLALVLGGRCYEREGLPFKAIDPLIDELSRYFRRATRELVASILPRDVFALLKLFPVLGRVPAIATASARDISDPYELQRRAFLAFLELIGRIRDRQPLILHIDDMHWTDADSATFLRHVLIDRALCPALFILSRRREGASNAMLERLLDAARANPTLSVRSLSVEPLTLADAERLSERLLAPTGRVDAGLCASIALEARGSPFFVAELARLGQRSEWARERPSIGDVISARVAEVSVPARRLLDVIALVGQPLGASVALAASQASHADLDALLDAHLLRQTEVSGRELLECYHDRIAEAVALSLPESTARAYYESLAPALSHDLEADPELCSRCWEGAGEQAQAARFAADAAERASLAMAFDHAAALYRKALELSSPERAERLVLYNQLGRALENGGRGADAASVYQAAAELVDGDESLELRRRAAEQLLATGHVDAGTALLRSVCSALDIHFPTTPGSAIASLAWTGLRLRARDLGKSRAPGPSSERAALRLRTAHTLVTGLVGYLPAHVASVAGSYMLSALDSGGVTERVRSIGFAAYVYSHIDPKSPRTSEFLARMDDLAMASGRADLLGFASLMKGTSAYHFDLCHEARRHFKNALSSLRGCSGVTWEVDACSVYDQLSAINCGDYADIARSAPTLVDEALRRGRVWKGAMLSGFSGMPAWLTTGDAAQYRRQLAEVARLWTPRARPHWPDYVLLMGEALVSIYEGQPRLGFELLEQRRSAYGRYMLTRGANKGNVGYATHHGRCAAAALGALPRSASSSQRAPFLTVLRRSIRKLRSNGSPKALGGAALLDAALCFERGGSERSVDLMRQALLWFERAGAHMFEAAVQRRLGQLQGGDEGRQRVALGDAFMLDQGVADLEAETELDCPGLSRR
jgi:eukaryotic-like serine/threonine-protein kinase